MKGPAPQKPNGQGTRVLTDPLKRADNTREAGAPPRPWMRPRNLTISAGVVAGIVVVGLIFKASSSPPAPAPGPEDQRPLVTDAPSKAQPPPEAAKATPPEEPAPVEVAAGSPTETGREDAARVLVAEKGEKPALRILVPAYFFPAGEGLDEWNRLIAASAKVPIVAIANPSSGPGGAPNADYQNVIDRAARRGVTVVGYVYTNYAKRARREVEADVDRWVAFYPDIRGIFFDAQATEAAHADHYVALREYARQKIPQALVITNPGTFCAEEYVSRSASDIVCVFESPTGFDDFRHPQWAGRFASERFAAFPYNIPGEAQMRDCIQIAAWRGIGAIYITDSGTSDHWSRLPSYWEKEVEAVRRINQP